MLDYATHTPATGTGKIRSLFPESDTSPAGRAQRNPSIPRRLHALSSPDQPGRGTRKKKNQVQKAEARPLAGVVTFRKAHIATDDKEEFTSGLYAGQACAADLLEAGISLTSELLATHLTQTMLADDPTAYNVGFLVSFVDACCRMQTTTPSAPRQRRARSTMKG